MAYRIAGRATECRLIFADLGGTFDATGSDNDRRLDWATQSESLSYR
jgi:hypothetical protein